MGMSASQARFLCLTARKNNVEFEGQQINQQRTTLSNESATYYSELCNMAVPVPPSIDDYTKISYTFNDGAMKNTVISLLPKTDSTGAIINNKYAVNYIEEWQDDYAIVAATSALVQRDGTNYKIGSTVLRELGNPVRTVSVTPPGSTTSETYYIGDNGEYYTQNKVHGNTGLVYNGKTYKQYNGSATAGTYTCEDSATHGNYVKVVNIPGQSGTWIEVEDAGAGTSPAREFYEYSQVPASEAALRSLIAAEIDVQANAALAMDPYAKTLQPDQLKDLLENEKYYKALLKEKFGEFSGNYYVRYVLNTTSGNYEPYFYSENDLKNDEKYNNKNLASISCTSLGSTTKTKEVLNQTAFIEKDASGRYSGITIVLNEGTPQESQQTFSLTATTTTDEDAYNDAMNQYTYKQHEYDSKVQEINSKLEIIQQQDKQLELKLKQLDTEENAISTEMDAVKKVISKNVESSFKTFNA